MRIDCNITKTLTDAELAELLETETKWGAEGLPFPELQRHEETVAHLSRRLLHEVAALRARPKLCVAALITDGTRIALVRNSKPGRRVETPGGKAKDGEAWPQAMTREIEEETGLFVPPADWVVIDVLCGEPVPGAQFASTIIVARATTSGPHPLRAGSDAADAQWYTRDEIPWGQLSAIKSREVIERWARSGVGASDDLIDAVLAHRTEVLKRRPTPAQERAEHMWRLAEREAAARLK
jgi:ADP-ribose pyrophosphatase YjhB (NUDIX family)